MRTIRFYAVVTAYRDRLRMTALIFLKLTGIHIAQDFCLCVHRIHLHTASMAGSLSSAKLKGTDHDIWVFLQESVDIFFQIMLMLFIKYFYFHHLTGIIVASARRGCCRTTRETAHRAQRRS